MTARMLGIMVSGVDCGILCSEVSGLMLSKHNSLKSGCSHVQRSTASVLRVWMLLMPEGVAL